MFISCNSSMTLVENLPKPFRSTWVHHRVICVVHVALTLVLCILFGFFKLSLQLTPWYTVWQATFFLCGIIGKISTCNSFPCFYYHNNIKVKYILFLNTSIVLESWISSKTIDYMAIMINIIIYYWSTDVHFTFIYN